MGSLGSGSSDVFIYRPSVACCLPGNGTLELILVYFRCFIYRLLPTTSDGSSKFSDQAQQPAVRAVEPTRQPEPAPVAVEPQVAKPQPAPVAVEPQRAKPEPQVEPAKPAGLGDSNLQRTQSARYPPEKRPESESIREPLTIVKALYCAELLSN